MGKDEQLIMVIAREILLGSDHFEGFKAHNETDYESKILESHTYMKRGPVETDHSIKQPIAYCLIVNPALKQIFAYQRASQDAKYSEKRLQGKWAWGVGGHIEKIDIREGNPIQASLLRELEEEVEMNGTITGTKTLGYINDDSDDVGKIHFGILYLIETDSTIVKPKDPEIAEGKLRSIEALDEIRSSRRVEEWSKIALKPLKYHFSNSST
ncbi:NUDIX domain-containing protein [Nanoarchaeota archaeon]